MLEIGAGWVKYDFSSGRSGLRGPAEVEQVEETLLGALRRYVCEKCPQETNRFGRLIVKILELRTICSLNAEKVMHMKLHGMSEVPAMLLETMFLDTPANIHILQWRSFLTPNLSNWENEKFNLVF